jgi:ribonuclease BN (tRNA processing enzyme)
MTDAPTLPGLSRRHILAGLAAAPALSAAAAPATAQNAAGFGEEQVKAALESATGTTLVLLGTGGGPRPGRTRRMTSHVMVTKDAAYVLDCGLGVTDQYARAGLPFGAIRSIFITHHHPDHNIEYGPMLVIGWINGLKQPVRAYGPPPLKQMTEDFLRAYKTTIAFWAEDFKMPPLSAVDVTEVPGAGPVMQDNNVKVTAALVQHPPVTPALAYRFDFHDRSIAFSGDTTPLDTVAQLAKGADVLVHEAMYMKGLEDYLKFRIAKGVPVNLEVYMAHMRADHSPVEDVGRIAAEAGVKTLVLSHLVPAIDSISDDTWHAQAAKFFKGKIIVAHDMMAV